MAGKRKKITRFSSEETSVFCEQIAMLQNSGIPLYEGVYMLYSEMEDTKTKSILEQLYEELKDNKSLYDALKSVDAFPEYMVYMIKVGETTGKLEDVLKSLADYYERESNVKAGIKSAITYPMVLFTMMAIILLVIAMKILPMFEGMFLEINQEVATTTRNMMNVGLMAGKVIAIVIWVVLFVVLAVLLWSRTIRGRGMIKKWLTNFHGTKKLTEAMEISKFISSMALMISSGIELTKAIDMAYDAAAHKKVKEKIKQCKALLEKNIPLDQAIHDTKLLIGMESRLVTVAAKTGVSDTVFEKLSEQYNTKITTMLNHLSSTIETTLVIILAVLIGSVLISVMLPMVSMISSIG